MKENQRIATTIKQLDEIFPGVKSNFEHGATKCWMEDEWPRGAWAFVGIGNLAAAVAYEGRIHFAGEHLSPWFSGMQGALWSGFEQ